MKIDELKEYAEVHGFDSLKFQFTNLRGEIIKCQWLDAYLGLFRIDGEDGFITVDFWKRGTGDKFEFEVI